MVRKRCLNFLRAIVAAALTAGIRRILAAAYTNRSQPLRSRGSRKVRRRNTMRRHLPFKLGALPCRLRPGEKLLGVAHPEIARALGPRVAS